MPTDEAVLDRILDTHRAHHGSLVAILQDLQAVRHYLPESDLREIAKRLRIPLHRLYGIARFYSSFSLEKRGDHLVRVCLGTACHVRGGAKILERLETHMGVHSGSTTKDGKFTLESVNCLGACAMGPLVTVDGEYHGRMTPGRTDRLVKWFEQAKPPADVSRLAGARIELSGTVETQPTRRFIRGIKDLDSWRTELETAQARVASRISVCTGTGCTASGGEKVAAALREALDANGKSGPVHVKCTGCHGFCERGPLVVVEPGGILYQSVTPKDAQDIVAKTLDEKKPVERLLYEEPGTGKKIVREAEIPFYRLQERTLFGLNGRIDPREIGDYVAVGGYRGLSRVLGGVTPGEVIAAVKTSGLRGRGGAGFPTGAKWEACRRFAAPKRFVIVNADEGDPGAFMDRSLLEGNPHRVIEGLIIGGYAVGASQGFVYVRDEYPLAVKMLHTAVDQAREVGLLGDNILGSGFSFDVRIVRGAGAFVCGEETALIASIEGRLPEPRPRPPYPVEKGLWGMPTVINNVKTWANVAIIFERGVDAFRKVGTEASPGTMVFSLVGKVNNTGLVEVPMGTPLRKLIFEIGGGIPKGKKFKAVQTGGPSGGCIPTHLLDLSVDYESLSKAGSMMGSGGMVVMDEDTCMVDVARYFLAFTEVESCGKCTPCREGTARMKEILDVIVAGKGTEEDIALLEELAIGVKDASLCGLGQTAPNPVLSTLRYFRDEYEAHVKTGRCPAGVCRALIRYEVVAERCNGCGACVPACPVGGITGEKKMLHTIDQLKCTKCGSCMEVCKFDAIVKQS